METADITEAAAKAELHPVPKPKLLSQGCPTFFWPCWVEDMANVSPHTSIHLETVKSLTNHPMDGLPCS